MDREDRTSGDRPPMPSLFLRLSTLVSYILLVIVNYLSNSGVLGPKNADISAKFPTPLTPAGWAFSIWGLIFGLQGLGTIYQLLPGGYQDGSKKRIVNSIGYPWQSGWYFQMVWQLCFLSETPLGMLLSLACLIGAFASFGTALYRLYRLKDQHGSLSNVLLYASFFLPTSVNTAWLSVASSVGLLIVPTAFGVEMNLEPFAVVLAALITILGVVVVYRERDSVYTLTLVWALLAVYGKQSTKPIRIGSLVCLVICCLCTIFAVLRRKTSNVQDMSDLRQPLKAKNSDAVV
eukprot:jgi/Botrbrau1/4595/Bobra.60_2s0081.1